MGAWTASMLPESVFFFPAAAMCRPLAAARVKKSFVSIHPAAQRADNSPKLWPQVMAGSTLNRFSISAMPKQIAPRAGWAISVCRKASSDAVLASMCFGGGKI